MYEVWGLAALWLGLALIATLVSVWFGIATALSEIVVGTVAQLVIGALIGSSMGGDQPWIKFLSGTGAIVLTFLAGAELDPVVFRSKWKEAVSMNSEQIIDFYENLVNKYPIVSIEDGMAENDGDGWNKITQRLGTGFNWLATITS